jgi:hypothetical protein
MPEIGCSLLAKYFGILLRSLQLFLRSFNAVTALVMYSTEWWIIRKTRTLCTPHDKNKGSVAYSPHSKFLAKMLAQFLAFFLYKLQVMLLILKHNTSRQNRLTRQPIEPDDHNFSQNSSQVKRYINVILMVVSCCSKHSIKIPCEQGNQPSESTKGEEFLYQLSEFTFWRMTSFHGIRICYHLIIYVKRSRSVYCRGIRPMARGTSSCGPFNVYQ